MSTRAREKLWNFIPELELGFGGSGDICHPTGHSWLEGERWHIWTCGHCLESSEIAWEFSYPKMLDFP